MEFVKEGNGQPSIWTRLRNQIYLGDDEFVEDMQCKMHPKQSLKDIPKKQKLVPKKALSEFEQRYTDRDTAMAVAYLSGHYTLSEVGEYFGVSYATVSRAVKAFENDVSV
jgi:hypothetical protein